jgi:hypothetical protein
MDKEAFDMIFEKAGVPHQNRFRPWESILGILAFSKKHRKQAMQELGREHLICENTVKTLRSLD